jgi:hypothetical protein
VVNVFGLFEEKEESKTEKEDLGEEAIMVIKGDCESSKNSKTIVQGHAPIGPGLYPWKEVVTKIKLRFHILMKLSND